VKHSKERRVIANARRAEHFLERWTVFVGDE
jgi:hypothetical protein